MLARLNQFFDILELLIQRLDTLCDRLQGLVVKETMAVVKLEGAHSEVFTSCRLVVCYCFGGVVARRHASSPLVNYRGKRASFGCPNEYAGPQLTDRRRLRCPSHLRGNISPEQAASACAPWICRRCLIIVVLVSNPSIY
jgi:hypothetical protein